MFGFPKAIFGLVSLKHCILLDLRLEGHQEPDSKTRSVGLVESPLRGEPAWCPPLSKKTGVTNFGVMGEGGRVLNWALNGDYRKGIMWGHSIIFSVEIENYVEKIMNKNNNFILQLFQLPKLYSVTYFVTYISKWRYLIQLKRLLRYQNILSSV